MPGTPGTSSKGATLVCVPIMVEDIDAALADAAEAKRAGADIAELRIDAFFSGSTGSDTQDGYLVAQLQRLLAECPLPVILTCRHADEGGQYDGDETDRVSLLEKLTAGSEHPPAYLDFELAAYLRSANIRQKINLCVAHPKQERAVPTRLILSTHDFHGRPADLERRLLAAYAEPACSVVKVAFRARSLRDNLELFDLTRGAPKPTIALGMGPFGLMSRVLAPKFGGFLTFASLRAAAATAPGQPTVAELLDGFRFRSIGRDTKVYGIIGWPVEHSLSPLVHNAGFAAVGHDGVYLPMPIAADPADAEGSDASFKGTLRSLAEHAGLCFAGASVTIPHKERAAALAGALGWAVDDAIVAAAGAANTLVRSGERWGVRNTDGDAAADALEGELGPLAGRRVCVVGAGGAAAGIVAALHARGATVVIANRTIARAEALAARFPPRGDAKVVAADAALLPRSCCDAFINCTPVGMAGGPDAEGLSIPVAEMQHATDATVFFDTVYTPIETPMLRAARARGCRTVDGVAMFVRQAAAQFEAWTSQRPPAEPFDRLVRARLAGRR
jgi:3-dehydroquinate dehydratase/shikimate dehydrogenase